MRRSHLAWLVLLAGYVFPAWGADQPGGPVDFERDVRPILAARCLSCHGPEGRKGGLRLDRRAEALAGGDSGPSFEPGRASESLLIEKVTEPDPALRMPPEGDPLTEDQVAVLRRWIDEGAAWGAEAADDGQGGPAHWAFQPVTRPAVPTVRDPARMRNGIDAFVLQRLDVEGIAPSPEAGRETLIRRLSLDLLGLPPTPEDVAQFVADPRPDAYERLVDRLLASPHYGERWGRHWLDLARYADSDGYEKDSPRPNAFRYRDWVIAALNRDLPYSDFSIEQLAGDLIPGGAVAQKVATGFHRNTLTNKEGGVDPEEFRVAAVIDRTNTTGTVWLGLTVGCAQCHSHKYDPLTQREYYGLFAFFNTAQEVELPAGDPKAAARELAPTLAEPPVKRATHVFTRGDFLRPGEPVEPGTPAILPALSPRGERADRLDLARWLFDPAQPLTARVAVNRMWRHLFGRPLVATLDDFGTRGERPTHPELLDWLADEFRRRGWSQKAMIRLIVTSATYRQSSAGRPDLAERDPSNALLARQDRFRLEAEILRDLALAAGGRLVPRIGGPSVRPPQPEGISELTYAGSARWVESKGPDRYRRGLYTWLQRTSPYPMLTTFDAPDGAVCVVRRDRSNTPLQALTLLNDAVFLDCARGLAGRVLGGAGGGDDNERLERALLIGLARRPTDEERSLWLDLLERFRRECRAHPEEARKLAGEPPPGADPCEAAAWVALARTILNLDEFVTRE